MEERKEKEFFESKTAPYVRESIFAGFVLGKLDERTDYRVNKAWNRIAQRSFLIFPSVQQFPISPPLFARQSLASLIVAIIRGSHNGIARVADRFKSGFEWTKTDAKNGV